MGAENPVSQVSCMWKVSNGCQVKNFSRLLHSSLEKAIFLRGKYRGKEKYNGAQIP